MFVDIILVQKDIYLLLNRIIYEYILITCPNVTCMRSDIGCSYGNAHANIIVYNLHVHTRFYAHGRARRECI